MTGVTMENEHVSMANIITCFRLFLRVFFPSSGHHQQMQQPRQHPHQPQQGQLTLTMLKPLPTPAST